MIIPIEAHLITLTVTSYRIETREISQGNRGTQTHRVRVPVVQEIPPGRDPDNVRKAVHEANHIWANTGFEFRLRSIDSHRVAAPGDAAVIDQNGFLFLAGELPARLGVSLLFVGRFKGTHLGGQSIEAQCVAILPSLSASDSGKVLAHELGHLLNLGHVDDHWNLMYLAYRAGDRLTADQLAAAGQSRLARRFGPKAAP